MSDVLNLHSTVALHVTASDDASVTIANGGPGTIYYGDKNVTASSNDGSIASGAGLLTRVPRWIISSTDSKVLVVPLDPNDDTTNRHGVANFEDLDGVASGRFNVTHLDYGAKGDGVTDDKSAIQLAIDAAEVAGGVVYLPPGDYLISDSLNVEGDGVTICGAGPGATTISAKTGWTAENPMIDATNGGTGVANFVLEDLKIDANFFADTCVDVDYVTGGELNLNRISNCWIREHAKTGIRVGTNGNEVPCHIGPYNFISGTGSSSGDTDQRGIWIKPSSESLMIFNNRINENRECGIYDESGGHQIIGNHIFGRGSVEDDGSTSASCIIMRRGGLQTITANYFDNCRQNHMIRIDPDDAGSAINDVTISANTFINAFAMRNLDDDGNANYALVGIDSTTASVAGISITNNVGYATSTTPFSNIVEYTSTSVSWLGIHNNQIRFCNGITENSSANEMSSGNIISDASGNGSLAGTVQGVKTLTQAASVASNAEQGTYFYLNLTANTDAAIAAPTDLRRGQILEYEIRNGSGGSYSATFAWNSVFKLAGSWTMPGDGKSRTIRFRARSTSQLVEISRAGADITTSA